MTSVPAPALVSPKPLLVSVTGPRFAVSPELTVNVGDEAVSVVPVKVTAPPTVPVKLRLFAPTRKAPRATEEYPDASIVASAVTVTGLLGDRAPVGVPAANPFSPNTPRPFSAPAATVFWKVIEFSVLAWSAAERLMVNWNRFVRVDTASNVYSVEPN